MASKNNVTPVEEPRPVEEPVPRAVVTAPGGLNLREGPGRDFTVLAVLPANETLILRRVYGDGPGAQGAIELKIPGWCYVTAGKMAGWVRNDYIASLPPQEPV